MFHNVTGDNACLILFTEQELTYTSGLNMIITKKKTFYETLFFVQQHLSRSLSSSAPPLPFPSVNLAAVISAALADLTQEDRNIWILFSKIIPLCFFLPCWHTHKTVRAETPTAAPPKHYVSAVFSQFHHSFCIEKIHFLIFVLMKRHSFDHSNGLCQVTALGLLSLYLV